MSETDTKLINFDTVLDDYKPVKSIQGHYLAPKWPFRLVITGPSGCGKSNLLLNLITKMLYFDTIYIFAKDTTEDKYQFLRDLFTSILPEDSKARQIDFYMHSKLDSIPNIDELDKTKQHLFVFDDMVVEKHQESIEDIFIRGRKRNISSIYLSQSYFDIPPVIRKNTYYLMIFRVLGKKELIELAKEHVSDIPKEKFYELFTQCTSQPFGFMMIDKQTQHLALRYRCGISNLLKVSALK